KSIRLIGNDLALPAEEPDGAVSVENHRKSEEVKRQIPGEVPTVPFMLRESEPGSGEVENDHEIEIRLSPPPMNERCRKREKPERRDNERGRVSDNSMNED